ncbi:hypothetical protein PP707_07515 [Acetobacter pasteurianus]|nr:hypothetical protein [Acetobacter pasteurianus]
MTLYDMTEYIQCNETSPISAFANNTNYFLYYYFFLMPILFIIIIYYSISTINGINDEVMKFRHSM